MRRLLRSISRLARLVLCVVLLAAATAVSAVVVAPQIGRIVGAHTSVHESINLDRLQERSIMYDRNGGQMAVLNRENRIPVKLKDVSLKVIAAILAVEDNNFYQHKGVNLRSVIRAFRANVDEGTVSQGGSTITQQVVKNAVVGNERTLSRKLREAFLATELEKQMSKDEILERYLNSVYFGNNAYGVQAAAQTYFNKDVKDLDWAEGAMLAALISSPTDYDPITRPVAAFRQRSLALDRLVETHKVPKAEAQFANLAQLPRDLHKPPPPEGFFTQDVIDRLLADLRLGSTPSARYNALFRGGLRIYTTFDPTAQRKAEAARNATMPTGKGDGTFDAPDSNGAAHLGTAAIVSVEPSTGAVRVMVGGIDPKVDKYNLADNARGRQPGSSFKPFVLGAGIEQGMVPDDTIDGTSPCYGLPGYGAFDRDGHPPRNYGGSPGFVGSLTQQVQASSNCAFLRLGQIVGADNYLALAKKMGIVHTPELKPYASAPIGTNNVSPFDMAAAYSVFANDGVRNQAYLVDRVEDSSGKVLFRHEPNPVRVMSSQAARLVTQILVSNVEFGTGTKAKLGSGQVVAGKTGTTENATDLWFVGYTPQLATSVWMGAIDGAVPLSFGGGDATGGVYAAATWGAYMNDEMSQVPLAGFPGAGAPRGGKYLSIGADNGLTGPGPSPTTEGPTDTAPPATLPAISSAPDPNAPLPGPDQPLPPPGPDQPLPPGPLPPGAQANATPQ